MILRFLLTYLAITLMLLLGYSQSLVINEFMASNSQTLSDEDDDHEDWIELYNASSQTINLLGYGLSDDVSNPFRWTFPHTEIPAGEFLVVWASGKDRKVTGSPLHTNFSISSSGEELLLTHPSGNNIDFISPIELPTDVSYGRKPDGSGSFYFFNEPTPGESNQSFGFHGITPEPVFSHTSGFYTNEFELEISSNVDGVSIYYTLDGSAPTTQSMLYNGPIAIQSLEGLPNSLSMIPTNNSNNPGPPFFEGWQPPAGEVFKTNVVRAITIKENYLPVKITTHSYLVHPEGVNRYSLPVFFLNTDADLFFDHDYGIYIPGANNNMFQRGRQWERPLHVSFFEADGTHAFSGDMGVRIHGGTTRSRPRKSLRFYARNEYGDSWINYQLFPEKSIHQYKRFLLRNSGNDWDQSVFRDGFMQYLARDLNVETQYYRPAIVFLNGEYWGIHNIRDRYDQHYMYTHYGLEEHEFTILQNNSEFAQGNPEGVEHYTSMRTFINAHNMSNPEHYAHASTLMDMESFIDERITNIFIMNTDWPGNNVNYFRRLTPEYLPHEPKGLDGRWRWHILDTDFGFWLDFFYVPGVSEGAAHNTLAFAAHPTGNVWPNPAWSTLLFRRLLVNETFKTQFINRFADLLNTTFKTENTVAVIDSIAIDLQPEMQEHIDRWRRPVHMNEWNSNVQRMRNFAQQRPDYQRQHIQGFFNLSGQVEISLSVNEQSRGKVKLNTIKPDLSSTWTGIYFKDVPIELSASSMPGYRFSHWSGGASSTNHSISIIPQANLNITAHFIPSEGFSGDELNPPPYPLVEGPYIFGYWDETNAAGSFPPYMLFLQSSMSDPGLHDPMTHRYHIPPGDYHSNDQHLVGFPYMLTGRSRINGLGQQGISFINTGRSRDLGAAVLAVDTRGIETIHVEWTGGTIVPNARVYAIRLQYKTSPNADFTDVVDANGNIVEYLRNDEEGHSYHFSQIALPEDASNQEYVQLRWKYYFTGTQLDLGHGRRDMLRLDNIRVSSPTTGMLDEREERSGSLPRLFQNYPNPAAESTSISFYLPSFSKVAIELFDHHGKALGAIASDSFPVGTHTINLATNQIPPGIYYYRMTTETASLTRKMVIM